MNNISKNIKKVIAYQSADTINHHGFPAWSKDIKEMAMTLLMVGADRNTFYVDVDQNIGMAINVFTQVAKEDPKWFKDAIVYARNEGFQRNMPILALVIVRQFHKEFFKEIFNDVILTGFDLDKFLSYNRALDLGFGRAVKNAIQQWIETHTTEYYAIKYRKQIADAIRLTHFKHDDPIYDYIVMARKKNIGKDLDIVYKQYPQIKALKQIKEILEQIKQEEKQENPTHNQKIEEIAKLIINHKLDPATVIGYGIGGKTTSENAIIWNALMKVMPTGMLLGYLDKLIRTKALTKKDIKWIEEERFTPENFYKAKVYPHRLLVAYLTLYDRYIKNGYTAEENRHGIPYEIKYAQYLLDILEDNINILAKHMTNNIWNGKWVVAPDISGSMTFNIDHVVPAYIAGAFAGMIKSIINDVIILPWHTEVDVDIIKNATTPTQIALNIATAPGGGTYMEAPMMYILENQIQADYVVLITDSEEWGEGWFGYWKDYKKHISPHAKAILIRVDPYDTNPFPPKQKARWDIYQVYGWSATVLKWIEREVLKEGK